MAYLRVLCGSANYQHINLTDQGVICQSLEYILAHMTYENDK